MPSADTELFSFFSCVSVAGRLRGGRGGADLRPAHAPVLAHSAILGEHCGHPVGKRFDNFGENEARGPRGVARILPLEEQPQNEKVEMDGWMAWGLGIMGKEGGMGGACRGTKTVGFDFVEKKNMNSRLHSTKDTDTKHTGQSARGTSSTTTRPWASSCRPSSSSSSARSSASARALRRSIPAATRSCSAQPGPSKRPSRRC